GYSVWHEGMPCHHIPVADGMTFCGALATVIPPVANVCMVDYPAPCSFCWHSLSL
ncbi:hypothetical protein A2U01_0071517, partial [Trifolium medium]|nr:hypothetical protein [Trifolium medium]